LRRNESVIAVKEANQVSTTFMIKIYFP